MQFEHIISDIITEVSYRSKEGVVDFKNPEHISILSEVLDEMGLDVIKNELFQNLFEAEKNPEDEKYKNTGGSGYVKADDYERWRNNPDGFDGPRFRKTDSGDYVEVDKDGEDVSKDKGSNIFSPESGYDAPDLRKKDSNNDGLEKENTTKQSTIQNRERNRKYLNNTNGIISIQNINGIDGDNKDNVLNGEEAVPGSESSAVAEIAVGYGMACLSENDFDIKRADDCLKEKLEKTKLGKAFNKSDIRKGALHGAKRELVKVGKLIEDEGLNPKTTTTGHVGGSKDSLSNTVKILRSKGVTEVNGIPINEYEKIILEGGGGSNPTDTMVVVIDESTGKSFIYHTSNKMSSADQISNGSPYKEIEEIGNLAEGYNEEEKRQLESYQKEAKDNIQKHRKEQKQYIRNQQSKMAEDANDADVARKAVDRLKGVENPISTSSDSEKYWKLLLGHTSVKKFAKEKGYDVKNLTPEQEIEIYQNYTNYMQNADPEVDRRNGGVGEVDIQIITRLYGVFGNPKQNQEELTTGKPAREPVYDEEELNSYYDKQTEELNTLREKMNSIKPGSGDTAFSKRMIQRLHLDVAEGHDPGGIPNDKFETIMGEYAFKDLKMDSEGNLYQKKGKSFFLVNSDGSLSKTPFDGELNDLDVPVVADKDTLKNCLGLKDDDDIESGIEIKVDNYDNRKVIIYDRFGKQIGFQSARSKSGPGGAMQDTIAYHKDFQECLAKQTVLLGKA